MFNLKTTIFTVAAITGGLAKATPMSPRDEQPIEGDFTIGVYNPLTGRTQGTDLLPVATGIKTLVGTNGTTSTSPEMYWYEYGGICSKNEGCTTPFSPDTPRANLEFSLSVGPGNGGIKQVTDTSAAMFIVPSDGGSADDVVVWQVCSSKRGEIFYAGSGHGALLDGTCQRVALQITEV